MVFNGHTQEISMELPVVPQREAIVYCLATVEEPTLTYIGATIDKDRRLKQHNGILVGGARATSRRPGGWYRVCHVRGFPSFNTALSFEWHWKHFSKGGDPLTRRKNGLDKTMAWAKQTGLNLEVEYS
jgi:predicted GIY-YIG superfamily endonuclease